MPDVTITFLDVGQGDATTVIDHETRTALLIDCPRGGEAMAIAEIEHHGADLDTVIVTHSHLDHFGGVLDVVEALGCRRLLYNHDTLVAQPPVTLDGRPRPDPAVVASLRRILELPPDRVGPATPGARGAVGRAMYRFLAPSHWDLTRGVVTRRANACSGVVVVEVDGVAVLVGGDADEKVWQRLLLEGALPTVEAVRWPHHGADLDANSPGLSASILSALGATVVAVSVGAHNTYGHPSDSFLFATRASPSTLMCTEATAKCAQAGPQPCAASIRVRITDGHVAWDPTPANHTTRVQLLPTPRCLGP